MTEFGYGSGLGKVESNRKGKSPPGHNQMHSARAKETNSQFPDVMKSRPWANTSREYAMFP